MKLQPTPLIFTLIVCFFYQLQAQNYIGHTVDNYAGVQSVTYNPATVVNSNMKLDINIFSASSFFASDYYGIKLKNLFDSDSPFNIEDETKTFPKDNNNFYTNLDIVGPSVSLNINSRHSIALISRMRGFGNINKINGTLFENYENEFDDSEDFSFENDEFTGTIHAWAEIGFTYGRVLYNQNNQLLKGGITLKYLQGFGAAITSTNGMQGYYNASENTLETSGNLIYSVTGDFDSDDISYNNLGSSIGADLGFVYTWTKTQTLPGINTNYTLKLGISVTDLGSISYDNTEVSNYDLNATIQPDQYDVEDFDDLYEYTSEIKTVKIQLPTALHILADYNITKRFYLSAQADFSLVKVDDAETSNSLNTFIVTPRFESKWFSMYMPLGLREYEDFGVGLGFRAGPLTLGSGSIISNLVSNSSKSADLYIGLKVPIYR
ncbi:hypothetical protein FNB79_07975 [Formosa sediminum]|uniref:DUF5723 domain-containing protein n=1 Tax=Formosa sediminum TaxID=2594004 RepID=A0A516GQW2_9FLAO|nr:DUF5723 family protein [Formosa sediminum]QDO93924.1 hypothetical protein FNB79_07975 [Formosa sediminum]